MLALKELINNPERMDRTTLYELRSTLALYPYFQTARLLMIKNLYLLHDPSFDEELRRAAIYITDRKVLFEMTEAAYYQLRTSTSTASVQKVQQTDENRTMDLIDNFLEALPEESEPQIQHRRPTPADAAVDYVAYLLATEDKSEAQDDAPQMKGQDLIDNFLKQEQGRIKLSELPDDAPIEEPIVNEQEEEVEEEYFTETLARIYIKQGRYQKALDIIDRLSKQFPQKNYYFADQKRFLEKLIINNKKQK
ncbi:MAG: tetratricopeptide repeat protein [Bacteroidales bacterium]|nr:tetratricopeptide repeat protein [Bacteroidales bacterium]